MHPATIVWFERLFLATPVLWLTEAMLDDLGETFA
ncbi:MAG: hypothetical protein JWM65_981 [Sphingomonas bacterium]|jgi:hypothetical protein|nr:hypothetical protein [Sphingomonas bacterium]